MRVRGGTDGGIGVPMRALRALYNFAIERNDG
jgi:integrase/recombinase XerD